MSYRIERLNSEIQKSLSDIIDNRLHDPRITDMITVTEVDTARDLKTAKAYVSMMGTSAEAVLEVLNSCTGFVRKELSKDFKHIRTVPQITFLLDKSSEHSEKINAILDQIKQNDHN